MITDKCIKINFTWENKGIILGIIYYILKRYNRIKNQIIILDNSKFRILLSYLFNRLNFSKISSITDHKFIINIKNSNREGLVINNLNNLSNVRAKKVYLLPWYDKDNPIVMYYHRPEYKFDLHNFISEIKEFSKCDRSKGYIRHNYITSCYKMNIWDTDVEYTILDNYSKKITTFNIITVYKLISDYLANDMCYSKIEKQILHMPIQVPVYIPIQTRTIDKENKNIKKEVKQQILTENNYKENYDKCINVIEKITNKIEKTNDLLDTINK